jgi:hypothetical protein
MFVCMYVNKVLILVILATASKILRDALEIEKSTVNISHTKPTNAHTYYQHHTINTLSLRHVSALKGK